MYDKQGNFVSDFSIVDNFNCQEIEQSYQNFKAPLCTDVRNGFVELLAFRVLSLPLEIGLCILGIKFVLRNKVDVPKYVKDEDKADSKKKSKKKKGKKGENDDDEDSDGGEPLATSARDDQNQIDPLLAGKDRSNIEAQDAADQAENGKKGCFSCCGKTKKSSNKPNAKSDKSKA